MEIKLAQTGAVFNLKSERGGYNQFKYSDYGHYYLIIKSPSMKGLARLQLMTITSMKNKETGYELPILINDKISYVAPYNIYTYSEVDLTINEYKGSITDEPYMSKNNFIMLLIELYMLYNSPYSLTEDCRNRILQSYNNYCESFWKIHNDKQEYRDEITDDAFRGYYPKFNSGGDTFNKDSCNKVEATDIQPSTSNNEGPSTTSTVKEVDKDTESKMLAKLARLEKRIPSRLSAWTTRSKNDFVEIVDTIGAQLIAKNSSRWKTSSGVMYMYRNIMSEKTAPKKNKNSDTKTSETKENITENKKEVQNESHELEKKVEPSSKIISNKALKETHSDVEDYTTDPRQWSVSKLLTAKRYISKYRFNMPMMKQFMNSNDEYSIANQSKLILEICKEKSL